MTVGHISEADLTIKNGVVGITLVILPGVTTGVGLGRFGPPRFERFFVWGDPVFEAFLKKVERPDFRVQQDLLGIEVEFDDENIKPTGAPKLWPESFFDREGRQFREGMSNFRARRLYACRARDNLVSIIGGLEEGTELEKNELKNLTNVLLRLILAKNDGQVSIDTLRGF